MVRKTDIQNRIIFVWLTKEESRDDRINDSLTELCASAHNDKFKVVVYRSGTEDLVECLAKLLLHQIDVNAKGSQNKK